MAEGFHPACYLKCAVCIDIYTRGVRRESRESELRPQAGTAVVTTHHQVISNYQKGNLRSISGCRSKPKSCIACREKGVESLNRTFYIEQEPIIAIR